MMISDQGANAIKSYEGCKLASYLPTPRDVPTIGYGATGPDIALGMHWTQAQADGRFAGDLKRFSLSLSNLLGNVPTTQFQFDAMAALAYNIGMGAFASSTVLRKHRARDYVGAAAAFGLFDKQGNAVVPGLVKRRAAEALMYRRTA